MPRVVETASMALFTSATECLRLDRLVLIEEPGNPPSPPFGGVSITSKATGTPGVRMSGGRAGTVLPSLAPLMVVLSGSFLGDRGAKIGGRGGGIIARGAMAGAPGDAARAVSTRSERTAAHATPIRFRGNDIFMVFFPTTGNSAIIAFRPISHRLLMRAGVN